jgi:hypothetical protein
MNIGVSQITIITNQKIVTTNLIFLQSQKGMNE